MDALSTAEVLSLFAVGGVVGLVATLWMDFVMARLPEGKAPPLVAAGVLTGHPPRNAPRTLATVIHYLAGTIAGAVFVWFLLAGHVFFDDPIATVAPIVGMYALMVGVFYGVLTQSEVDRREVSKIRRGWAISAAAYLAVLAVLVILSVEVLF